MGRLEGNEVVVWACSRGVVHLKVGEDIAGLSLDQARRLANALQEASQAVEQLCRIQVPESRPVLTLVKS